MQIDIFVWTARQSELYSGLVVDCLKTGLNWIFIPWIKDPLYSLEPKLPTMQSYHWQVGWRLG